mmetsp:Transcript_11028/g.25863  ORF Transcript_11028/g.25863 Transcript_11028/m.25863 type:complete len:398 (-) Transcript_11028:715-1908(-)
MLEAVAELEAQHTVLRQERVRHVELLALFGALDVVHVRVLLARLLVHHPGVAVGESAALHVLPRQPRVVALQEQRTDGEGLSSGPVDPGGVGLGEHGGLGLAQLHQVAMQGEPLGHRVQRLAHRLDRLEGQAGGLVHVHVLPRDLHPLPGRVLVLGALPHVRRNLNRLGKIPRRVVGVVDGLGDLGQLRLGEAALGQQPLLVQLDGRQVLGDLLVHQGLREHGLVHLVVPVLAVPDEVDHDVAVELLAVLGRQLEDPRHRLDVVRVHMKDGAAKGLAEVRGVQGGPTLVRVRREPNLVVADDVDGPAGLVGVELRHLHHLVDDALPREGRVAVDDHGQHLVPRGVAQPVHLGPGLAHHQRIHRLKVRRVWKQLQLDLATIGVLAREACAHVILDVAA